MNIPASIQDSVLGQLANLKNSIAYHAENIAPYYSEMQEWERKEYQNSNVSKKAEHAQLVDYVMTNQSTFNELLRSCKMDISAAVFIAKFASI